MKKTIFAIALMASLLAGAAETGTDSYLYWMVDVETTQWDYDYTVRVRGMDGSEVGSLLNLYYGDGSLAADTTSYGIAKNELKAYGGSGVGFYAELLSNQTYTSYVFEILSSDTHVIVNSRTVDITTELQACITGSGMAAPSLEMLTVSMPLPAPEPSSGVLLLLGVAGVARRRRKQIAA